MAGARILSRAMPGPLLYPKPYIARTSVSVGKFVSKLALTRVPVYRSPLQSSGTSFLVGTRLGLKLRSMGPEEVPMVDGARAMGGGPRTFPGGVSKWQWKRAQKKKEKQNEKARLMREKQLYEDRRRAEVMAVSPVLEKPWERASPNAMAPFPPLSPDARVKALADRFQKRGAEDLWTGEDGAVELSRQDARPSARFLPKAGIHSGSFGESFERPVSTGGKSLRTLLLGFNTVTDVNLDVNLKCSGESFEVQCLPVVSVRGIVVGFQYSGGYQFGDPLCYVRIP